MITIIHFTRLLYAIRILHIPVTVDTQFLFNNDYCPLNSALSPKQDGFCQNDGYTLFSPQIMKNGRGNAWGRWNGSLDPNSTHEDSVSLRSWFFISRFIEERSHSSFTTTNPSSPIPLNYSLLSTIWRETRFWPPCPSQPELIQILHHAISTRIQNTWLILAALARMKSINAPLPHFITQNVPHNLTYQIQME